MAVGVGLLETDADVPAAMEQGEVAVRKIIDLFQELGHEDVPLITIRIESEAAFALRVTAAIRDLRKIGNGASECSGRSSARSAGDALRLLIVC